MGNLFLIGVGGFLGAIVRYWLSGRFQELSGSIGFPYGTLAVNLIGCLVLGLLTWLVDARGLFGPETRSLFIIGLLGAFTTFSTFSLETLNLLLARQFLPAFTNVAANNLLGLFALLAGRYLPLAIWE